MKRYGLYVLAIFLILLLSACGGGEESEHYPTGEIKRSGSRLKDGSKDGLWTSFYRNGNRISSGYYENGRKQGTWTYWNIKGEQTDVKKYWQDKEVTGKIETAESKPARSHSGTGVAATMEEWKSGTPATKLAVTMEEWKARKAGHKTH